MEDAEGRLAGEVLSLWGSGGQLAPPSARPGGGLDLAAAYRVAARLAGLRAARGERRVGRKVGFTNPALLRAYRIDTPIWGDVWSTTLAGLPPEGGALSLAGRPEPQIEPEIVIGLARPPEAGMDAAALARCLDWVAPGFEIVQSIYPGWRFSAADAVAAGGLHGALLVGPRHATGADPDGWARRLAAFTVTLAGPGGERHAGGGAAVLGSPLAVLGHLVRGLAATPGETPLAAGDILTTGSLTLARPVAPGTAWQAEFAGLPFAPIALAFA